MKKKGRKRTFKGALAIIIGIIMGGIIGILAGYVSSKYIDVIFESKGIAIEILKFLILFIIIIGGFYLQIIIHEAGHLMFGLISGYKFVSFRVGSATLVREEGKWRIKKFTLPGTGGQCLMMPPEMDSEHLPIVMYNLGGVLANFFTGIIAISAVFIFNDMFSLLKGFLIISGLIGIIYSCLNGFPMKFSGIANDGSNLLQLQRDKDARKAMYLQLRFNGLLTAGERPRDINIEEFKLKEGADITQPLNTALILMQYNYYLDSMEFEKGRELFKTLEPYMNEIIGLYQYEIQCEQVFLELVLEGDRGLVKKLYNTGLQKYIKACKGMIGKTRVRMCYELLYNKNKEKAKAIYEEGKALASTYPIKGETAMELMLMEYIYNIGDLDEKPKEVIL